MPEKQPQKSRKLYCAFKRLEARPGRVYRLLRSTDDLTGPMNWTKVAAQGPFASAMAVVLADPSPSSQTRVYYRISTQLPD